MGEEPTVILYTNNINHHIGTSKQKQGTIILYQTKSSGLRCSNNIVLRIKKYKVKNMAWCCCCSDVGSLQVRCEGPQIYNRPFETDVHL